MTTFKFTNRKPTNTPISNIFIDKYMPSARGEFIKVYLMGLRIHYSGEIGITSTILASSLQLLETDIMNAWDYWNDEGVINLIKIDNFNNYEIEFIDLNDSVPKRETINLISEMQSDSSVAMLQEIQMLFGRCISSAEMETFLSWPKTFGFSPELIILLIQYCVKYKKQTNLKYIEKVAMNWKDKGIDTIAKAQEDIKRGEDKWVQINKILKYLGIHNGEVMKPQEEYFDKWLLSYNMPLDVIYKACDICFKNINKADYKYIDTILTNWNKENIKTLADIEAKSPVKKFKNGNYQKKNSKFFNFESHNYDYDDLEKKLLGWDNNDEEK